MSMRSGLPRMRAYFARRGHPLQGLSFLQHFLLICVLRGRGSIANDSQYQSRREPCQGFLIPSAPATKLKHSTLSPRHRAAESRRNRAHQAPWCSARTVHARIRARSRLAAAPDKPACSTRLAERGVLQRKISPEFELDQLTVNASAYHFDAHPRTCAQADP